MLPLAVHVAHLQHPVGHANSSLVRTPFIGAMSVRLRLNASRIGNAHYVVANTTGRRAVINTSPRSIQLRSHKQHISLLVPVELIGHGSCAAVQKTNTRHVIAPLSAPPSSSLLAKIKKILLTYVSGVRFEATICANA